MDFQVISSPVNMSHPAPLDPRVNSSQCGAWHFTPQNKEITAETRGMSKRGKALPVQPDEAYLIHLCTSPQCYIYSYMSF